MRRCRFLTFALFFWLRTLEIAFAASLFGGEFTMTNPYIEATSEGLVVNSEPAVKAQLDLLKEFTKNCRRARRCKVEKLLNSYGAETYKVSFKEHDGYWIQISTDPAVVEIQTRPATIAEYERVKPIFDKLFEAGEKVGIRPDLGGTGGGHIHMDFDSTFGKDARLFRNFLVDYMNNSQFGGQGIFGSDNSNAPHLALLEGDQKEEFRKIIGEFDKGEIKTAKQLAREINKRVYSATPSGWDPPVKYQALNLTRMKNAKGRSTIEFRAISPQRDFDEFLKQTKLLEARVEFLRKQPGKIKLLELKPMNSAQKIAAYRAYVEESGLSWDEYRSLVRTDKYLAMPDVKPLSRMSTVSDEEFLAYRAPPPQCDAAFSRFMSQVLYRAR